MCQLSNWNWKNNISIQLTNEILGLNYTEPNIKLQ